MIKTLVLFIKGALLKIKGLIKMQFFIISLFTTLNNFIQFNYVL